jgi:HPt (histidine-containing phosphotransfer) domain-containing protein
MEATGNSIYPEFLKFGMGKLHRGAMGRDDLLAEDSLTNQVVALGFLRRCGYDAEVVINGQEAISALKTKPYEQVAEAFLEESPSQMACLQRALAEGEAGELRRNAHTLKGAAGFFGAQTLSSLAEQMEEFGKNRDLARAAALMARFFQELKAVQAALAKDLGGE